MAKKTTTRVVNAPTTSEDDAMQQLWGELFHYNTACRVLKDTLEKCAKNYAGLFDEPKQRYTQRDKTFANITKWHCNGIAAKIKVDAAAITVEPNNDTDFASAQLMNQIIQWQLREIDFNEFLLKFGLETVIMGTGVAILQWAHGVNVKKEMPRIDPVSVLDIFTDPTVDSIQTGFSPSVIIRSVKDLYWVQQNPDFSNKDKVEPVTFASRSKLSRQDSTRLLPYKTSGYSSRSVATTGVSEIRWKSPKVVIYERWGIDYKTGEEYVTTVAGDSEGGGTLLRHKVNPFENQKRPIIECWYRKELGRWYGEGAAEILIPVQEWYNREVNQTIDNAESLQNQMYKVKRGAGIDPRQLVSRPAGGIFMENPETDLIPLAPTDIRGSFYKNENLIRELAQRLSGAFDITIGAPSPGSQTLGETQLQVHGATDLFEFTKVHFRGFLQRLIGQMVDLNIQFMDRQATIRITGDDDMISRIDELNGVAPEMRSKLGRSRFIKIDKPSQIKGDFDVYVDIEHALGANKNEKIQQTMQILTLAAQDPNSNINKPMLYQDLLSLLGKDPMRYILHGQPAAPVAPPGTPTPTAPGNVPVAPPVPLSGPQGSPSAVPLR